MTVLYPNLCYKEVCYKGTESYINMVGIIRIQFAYIYGWKLISICRHVFGEFGISKVSKGAKISNRYNQVPYLTQDTNGKVTNSQLDTTNESQEVSPFPAGDHKAHINRRAQEHNKNKTEKA